MYKIVTTPDTVLAHVAKPVEKFNRELQKTISEMEVTLAHTSDPVGVGLAAPQVGLSLQIFLARPTEKAPTLHFINPVIESVSDPLKQAKKHTDDDKKILEGCLSIPNIWGHVTRPQKVVLSYQDVEGKKYTNSYTGFMATIIQHEVDHLNGVLFTKHVLAQKEKLYRSYKNKDGEEEFEEIHI
ncbi:MAG TPA: peptide deformylase [Candidatus Levybacteria bacterium]|nr:peptide deformylase [Candidatus Levybacteria bacterium]